MVTKAEEKFRQATWMLYGCVLFSLIIGMSSALVLNSNRQVLSSLKEALPDQRIVIYGFDSLAFTLTILEVALVIFAVVGYWMIRRDACERAAEESNRLTKIAMEQIASRHSTSVDWQTKEPLIAGLPEGKNKNDAD